MATSSASELLSVELTASGNYIIVTNQGGNAYGGKEQIAQYPAIMEGLYMLSGAKSFDTRAVYSGIIYGEYTQSGDNEFVLNGFGKISVQEDGDGAVSLTIQRNGQDAYVMTAAKQTQCPDSEKTNNLCRTWNVETIALKVVYNGRTMFDKTVKKDNIAGLFKDFFSAAGAELSDEEIDAYVSIFEKPKEVVFTKSGTYMVYYEGGELGVSTWTWESESKGILRYSWNYEDMYDEYSSGVVTVDFDGGNLHVTSAMSETEDGETMSISFTWGFSEKSDMMAF